VPSEHFIVLVRLAVWISCLSGALPLRKTMSDASSLRNLLRKTDGTAPAIQQAAGAMMKHYDKSPAVAVVEWRNALHQARLDQHMPLLYVANEALQNSKRNRGNKFLEAFSPVLGQSLAFMCQKNSDATEKVRRTVKIWGDRHVFSIRFVNELLRGLEPYRDGSGTVARAPVAAPVEALEGGYFSPLHPTHASSSPPSASPASKGGTKASAIDIDKEMSMDGDDASVSSASDSDDGDLFGDSGDRLLNIDLDLEKAATAATKTDSNDNKLGKRKRRRGSMESTGATGGKSKRRTILSTNSLMELWNQVSTLQQRFDNTQTLLAGITPEYLDESSMPEQIDTLVGDSLMEEYKKNLMFEKRVVDQRKELHSIAQKRRAMEHEAVRYLPWLEAALKQDEDDINFCDKVMSQIKTFAPIHVLAKAALEERLADEARRQRELEEQERKKEEDEERKKFMELAMAKVTEAKPGMIWNRAAGEYQYRDTDESWRD
jgi:hypothetical protein